MCIYTILHLSGTINIRLAILIKKESLNSDGHQFHQYQQNEQSPLILTELTEHNKTTFDVGNPVPVLEQVQHCGR